MECLALWVQYSQGNGFCCNIFGAQKAYSTHTFIVKFLGFNRLCIKSIQYIGLLFPGTANHAMPFQQSELIFFSLIRNWITYTNTTDIVNKDSPTVYINNSLHLVQKYQIFGIFNFEFFRNLLEGLVVEGKFWSQRLD